MRPRPAEIWRRRIPISLAALLLASLLVVHSRVAPRGDAPAAPSAPPPTSTTTTTTTPTPAHLLARPASANASFAVEKYDALKVHAQIVKTKLARIAGAHGGAGMGTGTGSRRRLSSADLHLFYDERLNSSNSSEAAVANLRAARAAGAGVLVVRCSRMPPAQHPGHAVFRLLFLLAPSHDLKITIAVGEYIKRNVMSIRRDIRVFLSAYGKERALYAAAAPGSDGRKKPVVYVADSFSISANEWAEILAPNRQSTIRNTPIDCIVLGQLQHEEHGSHVRRSQFDGFFTGCYPNGESFGSTWKNWQSLSIWANAHSLLWSASIVDGDGGARALGAGLRTTLRSRPRPTFVSLCKLSPATDYTNEVQSWLDSWDRKRY